MAHPTRARADAASFAHLAGLGRGRAAAAAEDETDEERRDREERERDADMRRMEDGGEDTGESDDERDQRHQREESRGGGGGARSESDDGDDDSDREDMRGNAGAARRRERARCAAIFAHAAAGRNPVLAAHLAFRTDLSRTEAIRILRDTPSAVTPSPHRAERSAANPQIGPGGSVGPAGGEAHGQALWDRVLAKAGHLPAGR